MARGGARYNKEGKLLTGRPKGSLAKKRRSNCTIRVWPECLTELDAIGPSRGKAVEKLLDGAGRLKDVQAGIIEAMKDLCKNADDTVWLDEHSTVFERFCWLYSQAGGDEKDLSAIWPEYFDE